MSSPAATAAAAPGTPPKVELSANESWLLSHALKHHKQGGLVTSDIDWDAVVAEDNCKYKNVTTIKVVFNNLKRKLALNGNPALGAAAGSSTPTTPKTPRTPRKAKGAAPGSDKKTPTGVTKHTPRKSSINVNVLAAVANEQEDMAMDPLALPEGKNVDMGATDELRGLDMPATKEEDVQRALDDAMTDAGSEAANKVNVDA